MRVFLLAALVAQVSADCYMHNPRGSNNRLNEKNANRNNGDRLFDSQNNNRGGYNVGEKTDDTFDASTGNEPGSQFNIELNLDQYSMIFYAGSELGIEWTNQHGCGGKESLDPHKLNCNMVMQYVCNTAGVTDKAMQVELKDGRNTNTPDATNTFSNLDNQKAQNDANGRGRHESEAWYYECANRERNKGLFLADQNLKGSTRKYTRQNPNANRRGLECAEERDYYPNWNPSPWIDIAVLTDTLADCDPETAALNGAFSFQANSMNVKSIGKCVYSGTSDDDRSKVFEVLTQTACEELATTGGVTGASWQTFTHNVAAPLCVPSMWSRVNHLGNGDNGQPLQYNWTLPAMDQLGAYVDTKNGAIAKCVLRIRYNISTDDYDVRKTDASFNENTNMGIRSPVEENPTVDVGLTGGSNLQGLRLAINTNQFGRTFQDRSHTFYVKPKPAGALCTGKMLNLNARGKRGNIVQTFPSVEYDFQPNKLEMASTDCIHVQWTGSNTHQNGNPAGDGQAGDAGEGTTGTDRHNIVCLADRGLNYPVAYDTPEHNSNCLFNGNFDFYAPVPSTGYMTSTASSMMNDVDASLYMASSGYYKSLAQATALTTKLNVLLNNAPASLAGGVIMKPKAGQSGKMFHYMNTRNNNFSNRSQKGTIKVM